MCMYIYMCVCVCSSHGIDAHDKALSKCSCSCACSYIHICIYLTYKFSIRVCVNDHLVGQWFDLCHICCAYVTAASRAQRCACLWKHWEWIHIQANTATYKINGDRKTAVNVFEVVKPTGNVGKSAIPIYCVCCSIPTCKSQYVCVPLLIWVFWLHDFAIAWASLKAMVRVPWDANQGMDQL